MKAVGFGYEARKEQLLGPRTIKLGHAMLVALAGGLIVADYSQTYGLLTQVPTGFRATFIGIGTFVGILAAAVEREKYKLEDGGAWRTGGERGASAILMVAILVASVWGCNNASSQVWMWWTFRGGAVTSKDGVFTVISRSSGKAGGTVALREDASGRNALVRCHGSACFAVARGDKLILLVETGQLGSQRVMLPSAHELRRPIT